MDEEAKYPHELPKHKIYEMVTAEIISKMDPDAKVQHNVQIPVIGDPERTRQVDVFVEGKIGGFKQSIVVDCKHYGAALDVTKIDGFVGMLDDLRPNLGVLIGLNGFSDGATKRASKEGDRLKLCSIFVGGKPEFSSPISVTMAIAKRENAQVRLKATKIGVAPRLVESDPHKISLIGSSGKQFNLAEETNGRIEADPKKRRNPNVEVLFDDDQYETIVGSMREPVVGLSIDLKSTFGFFRRELPYTGGAAILDHERQLVASTELQTDWQNLETMEGWDRITEQEFLELNGGKWPDSTKVQAKFMRVAAKK